ncbi:3-oxoacyl-ACP synthase [Escherichia coli]|nr:3-oxoacyl-ACP synthase [Escherichia coli]
MKRAVITGLGIVSSIGNNQQEVLASLREGTFRDHFLSGAEGFRHA